jgi:hypothetical protein
MMPGGLVVPELRWRLQEDRHTSKLKCMPWKITIINMQPKRAAMWTVTSNATGAGLPKGLRTQLLPSPTSLMCTRY